MDAHHERKCCSSSVIENQFLMRTMPELTSIFRTPARCAARPLKGPSIGKVTSFQSGVEFWVEVLAVAAAGRNGNVLGSELLGCPVGERR